MSRRQNSPEMSCSRNVLHSFHGPGDGLATSAFSGSGDRLGLLLPALPNSKGLMENPILSPSCQVLNQLSNSGVEVNSASPSPTPEVAKSPLRWLLVPELKVPAGSCNPLSSARHSWIWDSLRFALPRHGTAILNKNSIRHQFSTERSLVFQPGMETLGYFLCQRAPFPGFVWPHPKPIPCQHHLPFLTAS